jgi:hypothetical protein
MGFRTVGLGSQGTLVFTRNLKVGDVFEGIYLTSEIDKFGGDVHKLKLTKQSQVLTKKKDDLDLTPKNVYPGEEVSICGGGGGLSFSMKNVPQGSKVRLTYDGKQKMKSGAYAGREAHTWKTEIDETADIPF